MQGMPTVEHVPVAGVVLEGEEQLEAVLAQLVDRVALEPGHLRVVTAARMTSRSQRRP